jgi:DNA recombination-dependent growth factor C
MQDISVVSMIFTAILVLGCLFLALSPLFKFDSYLKLNTAGEDLTVTKETLLSTLNEIEFDYKMDKISQVDYKNLKKQYESQIALILKDEQQIIPTKIDKDLIEEVDNEIEALIKNKKMKKEEGK